MLIGYVRVSKADGSQTLAPQRDALLAAGVDPSRIYEDLASGRHDSRPGLTACLKALQPGNTLVLWKLDRLGRDLRHLVVTAEALRERGIGLKVLAGAGAQIDTTTANGRLAFGIFAAFAEFERELIAERTQAGLAAARARGRMGGRPRKMDKATLAMAMAAMSDRNAIAADVARRLGMTTTTLYMYVNGDGTPKAPGQALLLAVRLAEAQRRVGGQEEGVPATARMDGIEQQGVAALVEGHPPEQAVQVATVEIQGMGLGTLAKPELIDQLQVPALPQPAPAVLAIDRGIPLVEAALAGMVEERRAEAVGGAVLGDLQPGGVAPEQRRQLRRSGVWQAERVLRQ